MNERLAIGVYHLERAELSGDIYAMAVLGELSRLYVAAGEPFPEVLRARARETCHRYAPDDGPDALEDA